MVELAAAFVSPKLGDAPEFIEVVRNVAAGVAGECQPKRVYVVRLDNWFGPRWLHFAGKIVNGVLGIWISELRVPPFVKHRVVEERVFAAPSYEEAKLRSPLHIEVRSSEAVQRRLADFDNDAVFVWFSSLSEEKGRGAVMVYLPIEGKESAFYAGFVNDGGWKPAMLRG